MAYVRHLREPTKRSLLLIDTAGRDVLVEGGNSSRERRSVVLTNQLHYATGSRDTSVPSQRHGQLRAHQKHKRTRRIRPAQTILQRAYIMKVERHVGILDYRHQLESAHRIGAGTGGAERGVLIAEAARNPGHQMQAEHRCGKSAMGANSCARSERCAGRPGQCAGSTATVFFLGGSFSVADESVTRSLSGVMLPRTSPLWRRTG